jgi:predicted phosphoribosyltransferase
VVATAVAPPETVSALEAEADEVIALQTPWPFGSIGFFYRDFSQVGDDDVATMLQAFHETDKKAPVPISKL